MNKQKGLDSIPAILPSAGRREPERSDGDRRHADGKLAARPPPTPIPKSSPKPNVDASPPNTNSASSPKPIRPKVAAESALSSAAKGSTPRS